MLILDTNKVFLIIFCLMRISWSPLVVQTQKKLFVCCIISLIFIAICFNARCDRSQISNSEILITIDLKTLKSICTRLFSVCKSCSKTARSFHYLSLYILGETGLFGVRQFGTKKGFSG